MPGSQTLIDGYLDETLDPEEEAAFVRWLYDSPQNRQRFVEAVFLHDRLRAEYLATAAMPTMKQPTEDAARTRDDVIRLQPRRQVRSATAIVSLIGVIVVMAVFWKGLGDTPAAAAVVELDRLIVASAGATDRTYQISVEEAALLPKRGSKGILPDPGRPPKPPLDGAVLSVRGSRQFVLTRTTLDGLPFVTGSNGRTSWAVSPDGPVRVSSDLNRFNRDLPGHESAIPLINIEDGLEHLRESYDVQLLPIERDESEVRLADAPLRLLVAVKKRGIRGPRRVEITYAVATGQIQQMRFIEMPYGPERLTLRLTLVEERDLGELFFSHDTHHAPDRTVEKE